ncbi:DUF2513 domain-containing protein [Lactococcus cremoris]|uniref:DUF2513 domain-containing protein n=1 Tax=Lactococcus lactis subsp. cremoris TaxID=1359 RepID=UPI00220586D0|nr:DUF2513 domain-containing protein [Lactococcus cremoris]UXV60062.1 DUF2513 domain-containing protein [Lactococcus cremoris]
MSDMKLNHDCVRDVLLDIEENQKLGYAYGSEDIGRHLLQYTDEEIIYSIQQLSQANLINATAIYSMDLIGSYVISGITWDGNKFLDGVRDQDKWSKIKDVTKSGSMFALKAAVTAMISHSF